MPTSPGSARDGYGAVVAGRRTALDELGIQAYRVKYSGFSGMLAANVQGVPCPLGASVLASARHTRLAGVRCFCQMCVRGRNEYQRRGALAEEIAEGSTPLC